AEKRFDDVVNRIWFSWATVNPDWSVPNFNCSAPPPEGLPFQLDTVSVAPAAHTWPLLFAKLKGLALPARSIVELLARMKRPSGSTALLICNVCERLHVPGLLMRFVVPSPMTQSPPTLILLTLKVPPKNS